MFRNEAEPLSKHDPGMAVYFPLAVLWEISWRTVAVIVLVTPHALIAWGKCHG